MLLLSNACFQQLRIPGYDGTVDQYVDKFKYALASKKERARFPDNNEFVANFSERQIYMIGRI